MFDIALFKDGEGAEDETRRLHLNLHDPGEAEADETLLTLAGDEANCGSSEVQGAIFPSLLTVDVIGARPAVDGNVPAHTGRETHLVERTTRKKIRVTHIQNNANTDTASTITSLSL